MTKVKNMNEGKKAYIAPVSYCLKVSSNNICVASQYTGDHTKPTNGGLLEEDGSPMVL